MLPEARPQPPVGARDRRWRPDRAQRCKTACAMRRHEKRWFPGGAARMMNRIGV